MLLCKGNWKSVPWTYWFAADVNASITGTRFGWSTDSIGASYIRVDTLKENSKSVEHFMKLMTYENGENGDMQNCGKLNVSYKKKL